MTLIRSLVSVWCRKMSRVLVIVDMEGAAGIGNVNHCFPWYPEYHTYGLVQLAGDVNAVVRGLRAGGVDNIVVCDMHMFSRNLSRSQLESDIELVNPSLHDLTNLLVNGCGGAVLLCCHAMAGIQNGFLSHTVMPFLRVRVNSQPVGEIAIISWLCGAYDVPVMLVTGDEMAMREAKDFFPSVCAVAVKKAKNREVAECFPAKEMRKLIEATTMSSAQRLGQRKVHRAQEPVFIEIALGTSSQAELVAAIPGARKTSPRVVAYEGGNYLEAFKFLSVVPSFVMFSWFNEALEKIAATKQGEKIYREWNCELVERWMGDVESVWL